MTTYSDIEVEIEDPVALIRLNRPDKLNAFTYQTLSEIRAAVSAASNDPRVVGIIITGNGRGFCAGLDSQVLAEVTQGNRETSKPEQPDDSLPGIFSYLIEVPKPVIAAINGVTAGGGLILALMSDLRIASRSAVITTVFLKRGLIAEHGSSWIMPRLVGTGRALDLLWMSDKIDAEEALRVGLVDKVAEPDELLDQAKGYVRRLAATSPPAAIAETKRLVYRHLGMGYREALHDTMESMSRFVATADSAEGAKAFIEKRAPKFERLGKG